jgi:integrase
MGNGALPNGPSYRAHPRLYRATEGLRIHDLRHTYASFGAAGGMGLPIIGKLLGHSQAATTARYAHLDNDPLRRASETIAGRIAAAMGGKGGNELVTLPRAAKRAK